MKYGEQLENESVPEWGLHNLDYNSLKHEIKVHTTRHQATAMAIPGNEDTALRKFEDGLFLELCRQHERVHLFVTSKADEISRRLDALSRSVDRWITKFNTTPDQSVSDVLRRQRRFAKHERELYRVGDDAHALVRFANAQVVAFRKIIKKYKKWTGSTTLGTRFTDDILSDPKSFNRNDYTHLERRGQELLDRLRDANPHLLSDDASSSSLASRPGDSNGRAHLKPHDPATSPRQTMSRLPAGTPQMQTPQVRYWNEYDNGSDAGDGDFRRGGGCGRGVGGSGRDDDSSDGYHIYVDPNADDAILPGLAYIRAALAPPVQSVRHWLSRLGGGHRGHGDGDLGPERRPLLAGRDGRDRVNPASTVLDSEEDGYSSSDLVFPARSAVAAGYSAHYALPSISDQRVARYRERVLVLTAAGCYATSFVLLAISAVLISTARHKMRVEVDAVVTIAVAISLLCAASALGATLHRQDVLPVSHRLMNASAFSAACLLNAMLLILVVGNTP
ncbi:SPX domain [Geosmithia morbida]|uniref:SPX domain n=1 Tax=Geosmithia morbida TaxID=1094350 RepID=A0A9P4Z156_9HYPO|nr:SPX domain [Geosmithia morbida]KAF4125785.1 SPX domain [Geosmithia morbida]